MSIYLCPKKVQAKLPITDADFADIRAEKTVSMIETIKHFLYIVEQEQTTNEEWNCQ